MQLKCLLDACVLCVCAEVRMASKKQCVLVTGGCGFVGSNLVRALHARGDRVRVLDDLSTGRLENLEGVLDKIEMVEGSLLDPKALQHALVGADAVLHQAALPSVPRSIDAPMPSHAVNATGTLALLEAARTMGTIKRLVYASSSSVYGNNASLPKHEEMATDPRSPYAASKLAAENYCRVYARVYGMSVFAIRYFNVFGPYQDPNSAYSAVIPRFILAALQDRPITVLGDGAQSRDFTFIDNVVDANLRALQAPKAQGEAINVACGTRATLMELLALIQKATGKELRIVHQKARAGDVRHSLAKIVRAEELLGYRPLISLQEGIERTVRWFKQSLQAQKEGSTDVSRKALLAGG